MAQVTVVFLGWAYDIFSTLHELTLGEKNPEDGMFETYSTLERCILIIQQLSPIICYFL
jgi:hypothetical protein